MSLGKDWFKDSYLSHIVHFAFTKFSKLTDGCPIEIYFLTLQIKKKWKKLGQIS